MPDSSDSIQVSYKRTIQVLLDDEDIANIDRWEMSKSQVVDEMGILAEQGYFVSVQRDKGRDRWSCSILGKYAHCPNAGYQLYGNGDSCLAAIKCALYKATVLLEGADWKAVESIKVQKRMS